MRKSTAAVSLALLGSVLAFGGCARQQEDEDEEQGQANSGHGGHGGSYIGRYGFGTAAGRAAGAAVSARGGFGATGGAHATGA